MSLYSFNTVLLNYMTKLNNVNELPLCACGCGKRVSIDKRSKLPNRFIRGHTGGCRTKEAREKQAESMRGKKHTKEARKKISDSLKGHKVSKKTRKKLSKANKGKVSGKDHPNFGKSLPKEQRKKISETLKGKMIGSKHPNYGKPMSKEQKEKISKALKGKNNPRFGKIGDQTPGWKGGISFEPYCPRFNNEFKERVREFFGRICFNCGKSEEEQIKKQKQNGKRHQRLIVHHINYEKMACCDDTIPLFVPLCASCHGKTNFNRKRWEEKFTNELMDKYNGECYLPKQYYEETQSIKR